MQSGRFVSSFECKAGASLFLLNARWVLCSLQPVLFVGNTACSTDVMLGICFLHARALCCFMRLLNAKRAFCFFFAIQGGHMTSPIECKAGALCFCNWFFS